jgi:hypothetical protein
MDALLVTLILICTFQALPAPHTLHAVSANLPRFVAVGPLQFARSGGKTVPVFVHILSPVAILADVQIEMAPIRAPQASVSRDAR